jgi:hypothetical protein
MFYRYQHESDIYPDLSRLPLHVRMKLDLTGIKIGLKAWLAFSIEERTVLCHLPVESEEEKHAFACYVDFLSRRYHDAPAARTAAVSSSLWNNSRKVPLAVLERKAAHTSPVTMEEWKRWKFHQRYALYKTALSQSEPEQFFAVLKELRESKD